MKHYQEKEITIIKETLEYITCDNCGTKIDVGDRYYDVLTGHSDWGNDSIDSQESKDICTNCIVKYTQAYLKECEDSDTAYLNISTEICKN